MKPFPTIFLMGVLCVSCATIPTPKSHKEILQSTVSMTARLDRLTIPLRKAGADLCRDKIGDDGIILHTLSDYPNAYQPVAKTFWDLDEEVKVLFVRPNSFAHKSGLKFGDPISKEQLETFTAENTNCAYDVRVRIDNHPNAYADGKTIFVTSGLMEGIDDLPLSLIIAHELAHNVLDHVGMEISKDNEREADRWAVFLLARANLDFVKAATDPVSIGIDEDKQERAGHFNRVITEIEKLHQRGELLIP